MSLQQSKIKTLAPSSIPNPADIGAAAQALRASKESWAPKLAEGLESLQQAVEKIVQYLKQSAPTISRLEVTNPDGTPAAVLGTFIPRTTGVPIINYFSQLNLFDSADPATASVQISIAAGAGIIVLNSTTTSATANLGFGALVFQGTTGQIGTFSPLLVSFNDGLTTTSLSHGALDIKGVQVVTNQQTGPGNPSFAVLADAQTWCQNLLTALRFHGLVT